MWQEPFKVSRAPITTRVGHAERTPTGYLGERMGGEVRRHCSFPIKQPRVEPGRGRSEVKPKEERNPVFACTWRKVSSRRRRVERSLRPGSTRGGRAERAPT